MSGSITLTPIGMVRSARAEPIDDDWDGVAGTIELDASRFTPEALQGLDQFSHIEVVFHFHQSSESKVTTGSRRPRGRADWPLTGIFAQRAKDRPNHIGVTVCRLRGVNGITIEVAGLDAIDGTPVLDIKPYMSGFAPRGEVREPAWAREIMQQYW
jgi:tRNA-Thr(GGU) m(6)t(6)A37 methyltransferase TsaA